MYEDNEYPESSRDDYWHRETLPLRRALLKEPSSLKQMKAWAKAHGVNIGKLDNMIAWLSMEEKIYRVYIEGCAVWHTYPLEGEAVEEATMSVKESGKRIGVSESMVRLLIRKGTLIAEKVGNAVQVNRQSVEDYAKTKEVHASEPVVMKPSVSDARIRKIQLILECVKEGILAEQEGMVKIASIAWSPGEAK